MTDEDAIRALLEESVRAWNRGDLEGFLSCYEDSGETTYVGKTVARGFAAIAELYRRRAPRGPGSLGTLAVSELELRLLAPRAAVAIARWSLSGEKESASGRFTLALRDRGEGWRILVDHTS
ncbi:SgcJ/EcaC family oxidoreductase [bacterium]|nr:SgcJ/EcaC family oxidoreductase [bacterium]